MKTKKRKPKKQAPKHTAPKSEIISNNIKVMREQRGWSQAELAVKSKTNSGHICKMESGERKQISLPVAFRLAKAFDCLVEDLFVCNI